MLIYKHFFSHFFIFGFVGFSPSYLSSHSPETKPVTSSCDWLRRLSIKVCPSLISVSRHIKKDVSVGSDLVALLSALENRLYPAADGL